MHSAANVWLQELSCKDQVRVAEVSRVKVELQEQIGHLDAERTAQVALKEKVSALEREIKGENRYHSSSCLSEENCISVFFLKRKKALANNLSDVLLLSLRLADLQC